MSVAITPARSSNLSILDSLVSYPILDLQSWIIDSELLINAPFNRSNSRHRRRGHRYTAHDLRPQTTVHACLHQCNWEWFVQSLSEHGSKAPCWLSASIQNMTSKHCLELDRRRKEPPILRCVDNIARKLDVPIPTETGNVCTQQESLQQTINPLLSWDHAHA